VPTWGIVLIVVVVLVVLLCFAFLVRKLLSKKRHKNKDPKKGMKGAMDVKGVPMLGALSSKVLSAVSMVAVTLSPTQLAPTQLVRTR